MKSKLIITGLCMMLISGGYVFAHEGHEHQMVNGIMMDDEDMAEGQIDAKSTKTVEVGNKVCPVSGDRIPAPGEKSAMGKPVKYEYNGKIYNLCCPMCIKDFKKNPEKYSKIAEEEVKKAKKQNQVDNNSKGEKHHEHKDYR